MNDPAILKFSLITSMAGILALFIISQIVDYPSYSLEDELPTEGEFYLTGTIINVRQTEKVAILSFTTNVTKRLVYFTSPEDTLHPGKVKIKASTYDDSLIAHAIEYQE